MRLMGKVAVVTGASGGMGLNFCKALLREGASVCVNDISVELVNRAMKELDAMGPVVGEVADVCNSAMLDAMVAKVTNRFGQLDLLINNAGGSLYTPSKVAEIDEGSWDKVVDTNLKGTFLCCQVAIKQFRKQGKGGKIVNISALAGRQVGSLAGCHYTAAKAGVIGLTRHLAHELGSEGIYVNSVAPTITLVNQRTIDLWNARTEEYRTKILSEIPLRRLSTAEDVAAAVIFLCSDEANYITGVTLDVNGGRFFS